VRSGSSPASRQPAVELPREGLPVGLRQRRRAAGHDAIGSNDVTLFNGAGYTAGVIGQAFDFGGDDDFAVVGGTPASLDVAGGNFSVTAWVSFDSLGGDMSIVDKMGGAAGNRDGWRLLKQGDNRFWFCLGGGVTNGCTPSAGTTVISDTSATIGAFTHVAAVKTASEVAIYVNGLLESTSMFSGFTDTNVAPVRIGGTLGSNSPAFLDGSVDEAAIWDRALSADEVAALATLATVPEPAAMLLMMLGLAGMGAARGVRRA